VLLSVLRTDNFFLGIYTNITPSKKHNKISANFYHKNTKKSKSKFLVLLPLLDLIYNKKQANSTTNSRLGENKQSPLFLILKEQFLALKEVNK